MSLRDIGRLGAGSSVRADLDAYLDDMEQLTRFLRPETDNSIKAYDLTIPALTNGVRTELTVDLGALNYPNRLMLSLFLASSTNTTEVEGLTLAYASNSASEVLKGQIHLVGNTAPPIPLYSYGNSIIPGLSMVQSSTFLMVYPDYRDARRFMPPSVANTHLTKEKYGSDAGADMPVGYSYSQIGAGVLVGWYGTAGVWNLDKKIELESMWIDNSDLSNIVLHLAFFNRDSAPNTPRNLVLGVYD